MPSSRSSSNGRGGRRPRPAGMTYAASGVDIEAGDRAVSLFETMMRRTHGPRVMGSHGAFAGMFRLDYDEELFQRNYRDPVLVACTDGVGTKVKLAAELGMVDRIGIDCVAMNVNDLIVQGAEPLFFLDYLGLHEQVPEQTAAIVQGIARGCEIAGCALLGGECAEMPDIYAKGDFDVAGFTVGVVELSRAIDSMRVRAGDVIIGLASDGVHSNGYSLVRRIIARKRLNLERAYPELAKERHETEDRPLTLGEVLLTPTRIYVRPIVKLLRAYKVKKVISGMAHITGGGLPGNVNRALPKDIDAVIDRSTWQPSSVFRFLADRGGVDQGEMERVFNMGIGYVLIVRPTFAQSVMARLRKAGERAFVIGKTAKGTGKVRMKGRYRVAN